MKHNNTKRGYDYVGSLPESSSLPFSRYLLIANHFTRPLSSLIVRAVYKTSITPNQLTFFSFGLALASGLSYSGGAHVYSALGGILGQLCVIFDTADGMLARAKGLQSRFGGFLDLYLDRVSEFFILVGIAVGYFSISGDYRFYVLSFLTIGLHFLNNTLFYIILNYKRDHRTGQAGEHRAWFAFLVLVLSLLNRLDIIIIVLLIYSIVSILINFIRFFREGRLDLD